jgi:multiple sugar transport system ATP-binding protein
MTMGDRVAVLRRGLLQQFDVPQRLYDQPSNLFVASFIGSPAMNVLEATVEDASDGAALRVGPAKLTLPLEVVRARPALARYFGQRVAVGIRPEALDDASNRNGDGRLQGTVQAVEALGPEQLAHVVVEATPVLAEDVVEGLVDMELADDLTAIKSDGDGARATLVARLDASATLRPDERVELTVDLRKLHFFDLNTGETIAA